MSSFVERLLVSGSAVIFIVALVGCGGAPAEPAGAAPSAEVSSPSAVSEPGAVSAAELAAQIEQALADTGTYVLTQDTVLHEASMQVGWTISVDTTDPTTRKVRCFMEGGMEMVTIGETSYVRSLLEGVDNGIWMVLEQEKADGILTSIPLATQILPESSVQDLGPEVVNGIETNHYLVTDAYGSTNDLYLDSEHRPIHGVTRSSIGDTTTDWSGFGEPMDIAAPDPSLIMG